MHCLNFSGTFSLYGNRHWPSSAMVAFNKFPLASVITKQVGFVNNFEGSENQNHSNKPKSIIGFRYLNKDFLKNILQGLEGFDAHGKNKGLSI